jgi:RNA polymerase sigma-70 factor (ECF subfamily)
LERAVSPNDDPRLILRAQAGDLHAFEHLLRAIEPSLRRYVGRLVAGFTDDVLQETSLRIWRGLAWLNDPALFRAWAYRIATREAHRTMRRELKREALRGGDATLEHTAAPFTDPGEKLALEAMLQKITPLSRTVLVAHYFDGLSLEEVAAVTDTPLGTVKSRLASGLKQARALMEDAA